MTDVRRYNRDAWNMEAVKGNEWTIPIDHETVEAARKDQWKVLLTPTTPVPRSWFPELEGIDLLCLAGGGGQQGPTFAAAGARVTVLDNSPNQLRRDRQVAEREGLSLQTIEGDMADLSQFEDESFDLIFHPCSNLFVPDVIPVWHEASRVLKPGGALLSGFVNPTVFIFDVDLMDRGLLRVRHELPYSDLTSPTEQEQEHIRKRGIPLTFGHTLQDLIGGQIEAGFLIAGFYEDIDPRSHLSTYMAEYMATRAIRPL